MIDLELRAQRRLAEERRDDPLLLYRFRVAAARAGAPLHLTPGDRVRRAGEAGGGEGLVLGLAWRTDGPPEVSVRFGARTARCAPRELELLAPHRPASLLGEQEFERRLTEGLRDPHDAPAIEALEELARRTYEGGIALAIAQLARVEEAPDSELRRALVKVLRSRPFGEVEVALRAVDAPAGERELLELPALAATAPGEREAHEVLDRFCAIEDPALAARVAVRAGKCLVGLGGPGFVAAEVRARVAELSRTHPAREVRVALFLHCVPALQEDERLEQALASDDPRVRATAAGELLRRGRAGRAWEWAREEPDPDALLRLLEGAPRGVPLDVLARLLALGRQAAALEEAALLRLAEVTPAEAEGAAAALAPWLAQGRKTGVGAALWAAGLVGSLAPHPEELAARVLGRLTRLDHPGRAGLAVEALARLGHPAAGEALQTYGAALLELGPWGEELVDAIGLLVGERVDARELLGRFAIVEPAEPTRRARALEAARALEQRGEPAQARPARRFLPTRLERFAALEQALG